MKALVFYGLRHGTSAKIAEGIAKKRYGVFNFSF
jgi:menaquinone-dependent protoporphyrinogen IX oxidase